MSNLQGPLQQATAQALSKCRKRQPVSDEPAKPPSYRDHLPRAFRFAFADQIGPALRAALKAAVAEGPWPILIHGQPGNGKSSAAAIALAGEALRQRQAKQAKGLDPISEVFWWSWETLVSNLLTARKSKNRSFPMSIGDVSFYRRESSVMEWLSNPKYMVVLDDFAVSRLADWDYTLMFELIDQLKTGRVILTSNNSIESMIDKEIIDERVASRLSAGTIISATGSDRRAGKRVIA